MGADVTMVTDPGLEAGRKYCYRVRAMRGEEKGVLSTEVCSSTRSPTNRLLCDCNGDTQIDVSDPIKTLDYLFSAGQVDCPGACNCNGDAVTDISDAIFGLGYLFTAGPPPGSSSGGLYLFPRCDHFEGCAEYENANFCPVGRP